jgi:hypothetical protein
VENEEISGDGSGAKPGTFTSETGRKAQQASVAARRGDLSPEDITDDKIEQGLRLAMKQGKPGSVPNWLAWIRQTSGVSTNEDILRAVGNDGRRVLRWLWHATPEERAQLAASLPSSAPPPAEGGTDMDAGMQGPHAPSQGLTEGGMHT